MSNHQKPKRAAAIGSSVEWQPTQAGIVRMASFRLSRSSRATASKAIGRVRKSSHRNSRDRADARERLKLFGVV